MNEEYLNQDIDNPIYVFHGSPKKIDKLIPIQSCDSNDNKNIQINIMDGGTSV